MSNLKYIILFLAVSFVAFALDAQMLKNKHIIYVYNDDGVSNESLRHTIFTLTEALPTTYLIKTINAEKIIQNKWVRDAALFVIPGGADLPYVTKLNGKGNQNIKNFVKNGGSYLGICAGAYYGSGYVEFDKGGNLEVLGARELTFFSGKAIGPILAKYNYKNQSSARSPKIKIELETIKEATVYYNGGGYFEKVENYPNIFVIGYYQLDHKKNLPAILHINYGQGNVILSGVHFEYDSSLLDTNDIYLKKIIPNLKHSDLTRKKLIKEILKRLGLESN